VRGFLIVVISPVALAFGPYIPVLLYLNVAVFLLFSAWMTVTGIRKRSWWRLACSMPGAAYSAVFFHDINARGPAFGAPSAFEIGPQVLVIELGIILAILWGAGVWLIATGWLGNSRSRPAVGLALMAACIACVRDLS
jgi:hypothetical protein